MNILIVDDNEEMRRAIKSFVGDLADDCFECEDGAWALAAYAAHRPDWVLMDVEMPVLDGITAAGQIKAAFPEALIVIITVHDHAGLRARARQAGAVGYVLKDDLCAVRDLLCGGPAGH